MAQVSPVNVKDLLDNIQNRYIEDKIFTMVGETLIIVNPYYKIEGLYEQERMIHYIDRANEIIEKGIITYEKGEPHAFDMSMNAIFQILNKDDCKKENQALVISGESGAGKTECAKLCMKFIAYYFSSKNENADGQKEVSLEDKILACNPVLEAFGNAKTVRNNNSSRFGKYIEIYINIKTKQITGALTKTYLLEKSRVCSVFKPERGYHIFYQVIFGLNYLIANKFDYEKVFEYMSSHKLPLLDKSKEYIKTYLNEKNVMELFGQTQIKELKIKDFVYLFDGEETVKGIDDVFNFYECLQALIQTNFSFEEIHHIWKIIMAILFLGNVTFQGEEKSSINPNSKQFLTLACKILTLNEEKLELSFTHTLFVEPVTKERIYKPVQKIDAESNRDTFTKEIYSRLFDKLRDKMNLTVYDVSKESEYADENTTRTIGLLDIFGFECFKTNSLEQFCINYANEKLQQLYINDIFKEIENMFVKEGLSDRFQSISYKDNKYIIDAMGAIFKTTNEKCLISKDEYSKKDKGLLSAILAMKKDDGPIKKDIHLPDGFNFIHTAKEVPYSINGFSMKNEDYFQPLMTEALQSITDDESKKLIVEIKDESSGQDKGKGSKDKYIGAKFTKDMNNLAEDLGKCSRYYLRCLKPNSTKSIHVFEQYLSLQQIKYMGVLDTIRIRQANFPIIKSHYDYYRRYEDACDFEGKIFIDNINDSNPNLATWIHTVTKILMKEESETDILFGKSKVLLKQEYLDKLDIARKEKIRTKAEAVTNVCLRYRGKRPKKVFENFYKTIFKLQQNYKLFKYISVFNSYKEIATILQNRCRKSQYEKYNETYFSKLEKIKKLIEAEKYRKLFEKAYVKISQTKLIISTYISCFKQKKLINMRKKVNAALFNNLNKKIYKLYEKEANLIQNNIRSFLTKHRLGDSYIEFLNKKKSLKDEIKIIKIQKYVKQAVYSRKIELLQKAVSNFVGLFKYNDFHVKIAKEKNAATKIQREFKRGYYKKLAIETNLREFTEEENKLAEESCTVTNSVLFPSKKTQEIEEDDIYLKEETEKEEKEKKSFDKLLRTVDPSSIPEITIIQHSNFDKPQLFFFAYILDIEFLINPDDIYQVPWSETFQEVFNYNIEQNTPIQVIEIGDTHTTLVNTSGKVYTWGWNGNGQCGFIQKNDEQFKFEDFSCFQGNSNKNVVKARLEDTPLNMEGGLNEEFNFDEELKKIKEENEYFSNTDDNDNLITSEQFNDFYYINEPLILDNYKISKITCGEDFTLALDNKNGVCVFGANNFYQLGIKSSRNIYDPVSLSDIIKREHSQIKTDNPEIVDFQTSGKNNILITKNGNIIMLSCLNKNQIPYQIPFEISIPNAKFVNVECGKDFCLLLTGNGILYAFGDNKYGQLGMGDTESRYVPTCVNFFMNKKEKIFQISCGYKHCACKGLKQAYVWGNNSAGQLGTGNLISKSLPTVADIKTSAVGNNVIQVSCGFRSTVVMCESRKIFWCGSNGDLKSQYSFVEFDYVNKCPNLFEQDNHKIIKINHTWSKTMSIMYGTIAETALVKKKLKSVVKLNFLLNSLTSKWKNRDLYAPPVEHMNDYINEKHLKKENKKNKKISSRV